MQKQSPKYIHAKQFQLKAGTVAPGFRGHLWENDKLAT